MVQFGLFCSPFEQFISKLCSTSWEINWILEIDLHYLKKVYLAKSGYLRPGWKLCGKTELGVKIMPTLYYPFFIGVSISDPRGNSVFGESPPFRHTHFHQACKRVPLIRNIVLQFLLVCFKWSNRLVFSEKSDQKVPYDFFGRKCHF